MAGPSEQDRGVAAESPVSARDLRRLFGALDAGGDRRSAVRLVEQRQIVGSVAEHRHAECFQQFGRRGNVQDGLHARGDDQRLGSDQLAEVGRDVRRSGEAAVDAAEAARAHETDPDDPARRERAADRRRADDALGNRRREVARTHLARLGGEAAELVLRQADAQQPVQNADRRGHGACRAHPPLALETDRDTLAGREAVRDERRLERDHRSPVCERMADLVRDLEQIHHGIEPSFATQRAAAASASSGPPTR